MRKTVIAAAAFAFATAAHAQTPGPYVGIEGGILLPRDDDDADLKTGFDIDAIAGYNFNNFRLEGELGYKSAGADFEGDANVLSGMVNALAYYGGAGYGVYGGLGAGRARLSALDESEGAWAGQLIAGAHVPVHGSVTAGLKYRYFVTGTVDFAGESGRFRSHSLLASLVYNFGPPLPDPPLPDLPPLDEPIVDQQPQTPTIEVCPSGHMRLSTMPCPEVPQPERG